MLPGHPDDAPRVHRTLLWSTTSSPPSRFNRRKNHVLEALKFGRRGRRLLRHSAEADAEVHVVTQRRAIEALPEPQHGLTRANRSAHLGLMLLLLVISVVEREQRDPFGLGVADSAAAFRHQRPVILI